MPNITIHFLNLEKVISVDGYITFDLIDDFYFSPKKKTQYVSFENESEVNIDLEKGTYSIEIKIIIIKKHFLFFKKKKSYVIKKIQTYSKNIIVQIDLLDVKQQTVSSERIKKEYFTQRTDLNSCFLCHNKYSSYTDRFSCKYCGKFFCTKHRLPEDHNCWGRPRSPSGGIREIHSGGKITVSS